MPRARAESKGLAPRQFLYWPLDEHGVVLDRQLHPSCRFAVAGVDEAAGEDSGGRDECGEQGSGVTGYGKHGVNLLYGTGTAVRARRSAAWFA